MKKTVVNMSSAAPPYKLGCCTTTNSMSGIPQQLLPNFDQTSNIGSWHHLEQIPTVTGIFVQATFVMATFVHIRIISAVDFGQILNVGS